MRHLQTSKMERFVKLVIGFWPLNILIKLFISDFRQGPEYASIEHLFSLLRSQDSGS